ncbi:predicted protein [Postia placenta Mad-698-R]|nr:predicted protein [Postia placenta Mad-698-R]
MASTAAHALVLVAAGVLDVNYATLPCPACLDAPPPAQPGRPICGVGQTSDCAFRYGNTRGAIVVFYLVVGLYGIVSAEFRLKAVDLVDKQRHSAPSAAWRFKVDVGLIPLQATGHVPVQAVNTLADARHTAFNGLLEHIGALRTILAESTEAAGRFLARAAKALVEVIKWASNIVATTIEAIVRVILPFLKWELGHVCIGAFWSLACGHTGRWMLTRALRHSEATSIGISRASAAGGAGLGAVLGVGYFIPDALHGLWSWFSLIIAGIFGQAFGNSMLHGKDSGTLDVHYALLAGVCGEVLLLVLMFIIDLAIESFD